MKTFKVIWELLCHIIILVAMVAGVVLIITKPEGWFQDFVVFYLLAISLQVSLKKGE